YRSHTPPVTDIFTLSLHDALPIFKMLIGDMKVMIPKVQISKLNIRPVADLDSVKNIAKIFERNEDRESIPWKQRNKIFMDKIKRSEEHTSELQSRFDLVCRLLLEQ